MFHQFFKLLLICILIVSVIVGDDKLKDEDTYFCGDITCREPISEAIATLDYSPLRRDHLSFSRNEKVMILGKPLQTDKPWFGDIRGKIGKVPSNLIREVKMLVKNSTYHKFHAEFVFEDVSLLPVQTPIVTSEGTSNSLKTDINGSTEKFISEKQQKDQSGSAGKGQVHDNEFPMKYFPSPPVVSDLTQSSTSHLANQKKFSQDSNDNIDSNKADNSEGEIHLSNKPDPKLRDQTYPDDLTISSKHVQPSDSTVTGLDMSNSRKTSGKDSSQKSNFEKHEQESKHEVKGEANKKSSTIHDEPAGSNHATTTSSIKISAIVSDTPSPDKFIKDLLGASNLEGPDGDYSTKGFAETQSKLFIRTSTNQIVDYKGDVPTKSVQSTLPDPATRVPFQPNSPTDSSVPYPEKPLERFEANNFKEKSSEDKIEKKNFEKDEQNTASPYGSIKGTSNLEVPDVENPNENYSETKSKGSIHTMESQKFDYKQAVPTKPVQQNLPKFSVTAPLETKSPTDSHSPFSRKSLEGSTDKKSSQKEAHLYEQREEVLKDEIDKEDLSTKFKQSPAEPATSAPLSKIPLFSSDLIHEDKFIDGPNNLEESDEQNSTELDQPERLSQDHDFALKHDHISQESMSTESTRNSFETISSSFSDVLNESNSQKGTTNLEESDGHESTRGDSKQFHNFEPFQPKELPTSIQPTPPLPVATDTTDTILESLSRTPNQLGLVEGTRTSVESNESDNTQEQEHILEKPDPRSQGQNYPEESRSNTNHLQPTPSGSALASPSDLTTSSFSDLPSTEVYPEDLSDVNEVDLTESSVEYNSSLENFVSEKEFPINIEHVQSAPSDPTFSPEVIDQILPDIPKVTETDILEGPTSFEESSTNESVLEDISVNQEQQHTNPLLEHLHPHSPIEECRADFMDNDDTNYKEVDFSFKTSVTLAIRHLSLTLIGFLPEHLQDTILDVKNSLIITGIIALTLISICVPYFFIETFLSLRPLKKQVIDLNKTLWKVSTAYENQQEEYDIFKKKALDYDEDKKEIEQVELKLHLVKKIEQKLKEENKSLKKRLNADVKVATELEILITKTMTERDQILDERNKLQTIVLSLQSKLKDTTDELESVEGDASNIKMDFELLSHTNENLELRGKAFQKEILELKTKLNLEVDVRRKLQNEIDEIVQVKNSLQQELLDFQAVLHKYEETVNGLNDEISVKENELVALKETLGEDSPLVDIADMSAKLKISEGQATSLQSRVESITFENTSLTRDFENAKENLNRIQIEKNEAETRLHVLESYFKEKEEELRRVVEKHEMEKEIRGKDKDELVQMIEDKHNEVQHLTQSLIKLKEEFDETKQTHRNEIRTLEAKGHETWLSLCQSERKAQEVRKDAELLRQNLTAITKAQDEANGVLSSNGEVPYIFSQLDLEEVPLPILPDEPILPSYFGLGDFEPPVPLDDEDDEDMDLLALQGRRAIDHEPQRPPPLGRISPYSDQADDLSPITGIGLHRTEGRDEFSDGSFSPPIPHGGDSSRDAYMNRSIRGRRILEPLNSSSPLQHEFNL